VPYFPRLLLAKINPLPPCTFDSKREKFLISLSSKIDKYEMAWYTVKPAYNGTIKDWSIFPLQTGSISY